MEDWFGFKGLLAYFGNVLESFVAEPRKHPESIKYTLLDGQEVNLTTCCYGVFANTNEEIKKNPEQLNYHVRNFIDILRQADDVTLAEHWGVIRDPTHVTGFYAPIYGSHGHLYWSSTRELVSEELVNYVYITYSTSYNIQGCPAQALCV